jgi:hypothetical protein
MKLEFGTLKFNSEEEYYTALGTFCNDRAFTISYEPNKSTGSYTDAYRMRKLATAQKLIDPIEDAIRSGNRINCNSYVENLIKNHSFVQTGSLICGALENVIKTIPDKFFIHFIEGYIQSASIDEKSIVIYKTETIKTTASSLKKVNIPKSIRSNLSYGNSSKNGRKKSEYITEHIKNTAIGKRGEKLVFESEKKKLKDAVKAGKIASMDELLKWVSIEDDTAGYDILSYSVDAKQPIYIEVKTTTGSKMTPFYISENELAFSKNNASCYHLYRVFNFNKDIAEYYELTGDISESTEVQIDAINFLVSIK